MTGFISTSSLIFSGIFDWLVKGILDWLFKGNFLIKDVYSGSTSFNWANNF